MAGGHAQGFLAGLRIDLDRIEGTCLGIRREIDLQAAFRAGSDVRGRQGAAAHAAAVDAQFVGVVELIQIGEEEAVGQLDGRTVAVETDVLVDLLDLLHRGMRGAVGIDQAVAAEVAVGRGLVAEVSAVGPEAAVTVHPDALVHPVPDEAALELLGVVINLPEVHEVTGAVAHRVRVFAIDVGTVELTRVGGQEALLGGIHRPGDVAVEVIAGVAIDDGAHLLLGLEGLVGLLEIDSAAGFVAQREEDHAGVVLGALVHAEFPLELGGEVARIAGRAAPAVALNIGLAAHVETVFVAEFVEAALLRVMAGADGVDVVLLHQFEVAPHQLLRHDVPGVGGVLVDVDALDHHALAVDEEVRALHTGGAETDARAGVFGLAILAGQGEQGGVEHRLLGAPGPHVRDDVVEIDHLSVGELCGGGDRFGLLLAPDFTSFRIEQGQGDAGPAGTAAGGSELDAEVQHAVAQVLAQGGFDNQVADQQLRTGGQVDVALDAADAPEVLALIIAARTPAVDFHRQEVLAVLEVGGQVELRGVLGILGVADLPAVEVEDEPGLHTAQLDEDLTAPPGGRKSEFHAVEAARNDVREDRLLAAAVGRPLEGGIDVDGGAVALELPVGGNGDPAPGRVVKAGVGESLRQFAVVVGPDEVPLAVQGLEELRGGVVVLEGRVAAAEHHIIGVGILFVHGRGVPVGPDLGAQGLGGGEGGAQCEAEAESQAFHIQAVISSIWQWGAS